MNTQRLFMNVYRAGTYHRQGKPSHCNVHAGDFFTSWAAAIECVEHDKGYIGTVAFDMPVPEGCTVLENPPNSIPTPLHETRRNPQALAPWHTQPAPAGPVCREWPTGWDNESLDTSEREARPYVRQEFVSEDGGVVITRRAP